MMKSLAICLAMLSVAAVAVADASEEVTNDNVVAVLRVDSTAVRTIVAVPWCAMSTNDEQLIQVSNVVKTANLTAGDMLYAYNGSLFDSWRLTKGDDDVLYWASTKQCSQSGNVLESDSASDYPVSRGKSIMLIRQNPTNTTTNVGTAIPFYLYGQVGTNATITSTISAGSSSSPVYSLISNPNPTQWLLNNSELVDWENVNASDKIYVFWANGKTDEISRYNNKWYWWKSTEETLGGKTIIKKTREEYPTYIPAGQGIWYYSFGSDAKVTWKALPTK